MWHLSTSDPIISNIIDTNQWYFSTPAVALVRQTRSSGGDAPSARVRLNSSQTPIGRRLRGVQPAQEYAPAGDPPNSDDLIEGLFREHYPKVVGMLTRLTGDRGRAEELASDAFCKLSGRRRILEHENLTAWLYRAATNAGLDALRSNARRKRREQNAKPTGAGAAEDALQGILRAERCRRVRLILGGLKARDAQLLLLRAEGLAYRELADVLGIHPGSVGTLLARAEAEFERKYRARYGEEV